MHTYALVMAVGRLCGTSGRMHQIGADARHASLCCCELLQHACTAAQSCIRDIPCFEHMLSTSPLFGLLLQIGTAGTPTGTHR